MKESPFVKIFETVASEISSDGLIVKRGANLFYQLHLNKDLRLTVTDTINPKRGNSAFQTDICIFEKIKEIELPRIVIEFKTRITTHDILTYSTKAGKHKKIYPFLRYGLLVSEIYFIPNRFFIHNENLDFFIAAKQYKDKKTLRNFAHELLEKELSISRTLEKIHFENEKYDYYRTDVIFRNFGEL